MFVVLGGRPFLVDVFMLIEGISSFLCSSLTPSRRRRLRLKEARKKNRPVFVCLCVLIKYRRQGVIGKLRFWDPWKIRLATGMAAR